MGSEDTRPLRERLGALDDGVMPESEGDSFLLDEGLALLAAYRSIRDKRLRLSIKRLIEATASAQQFD